MRLIASPLSHPILTPAQGKVDPQSRRLTVKHLDDLPVEMDTFHQHPAKHGRVEEMKQDGNPFTQKLYR